MRLRSAALALAGLILCLLGSPAAAQRGADTTASDTREGQRDAHALIARDSLALLVSSHVTTRTASTWLGLLAEDYGVRPRFYPWLLAVGETPPYSPDYIEGFNGVMRQEVRRRFGADAFERLQERADLRAAQEGVAEWMRTWERQEDETGVRVEGWAPAYAVPGGLGAPPPYPLIVTVDLTDAVCFDSQPGWAEAVTVENAEAYPAFGARALQIIAGLRFSPTPGREVDRCDVVVPITFAEP